jgi:acetyltransferase-like isoleucine patch superfamily enzyme
LGYSVGNNVRIGLTLIDVAEASIGDDVQIGHGNAFLGVKRLHLDEHVRVGHLNIVRGGDEVVFGAYAEVLRLNQLNSIPDPEVVNPIKPRLYLGPGSVITSGHKIDFTDEVRLGRRVILGGRNSSIWTHNRQRTAPVSIGEMTYVGSEIRMAPGSAIPERCIVGIGAVIVDAIELPEHLIGGVPARAIKPLSDEDLFLVERKTRDDLPDHL